MTVRFVREASQEFLDAIRYYEEAEPGLGRRFSFELERTVRHLGDHPETYRIRRCRPTAHQPEDFSLLSPVHHAR